MKRVKHQFTKIVVFLLAVLFVVTQPFSTWAAGKDVMDNYVISTIFEQRQASRLVNSNGSINYHNMYDYRLSIDLSDYDMDNLAVSMKLYVEQVEGNHDVMDIFSKYAAVDVANAIGDTNSYISWNMNNPKTAEGNDIVEGEWNDILLPFSAGTKKDGFDLSQQITYFNFALLNLPEDIGIQTVRLKDVCIVDMSKQAQKDDSGEDKNWDTTYEVKDVPLTLDGTQTKKGGYIGQTITFDPVLDLTSHNPEKLQIQMDIEVENKTNPGSIAVLQSAIGSEVELSSGGGENANDLTWNLSKLPWQHGKATYQLKFSAASIEHGDVDLSKLNYMRVYFAHWPADEEVQIKVSNVKIIDVTDACRMPTIFGDGMMFQQNKPMQVWGNAKAGNDITVRLKKNEQVVSEKTVKTGDDGKWLVSLPAQKGSYDTYTMDILENGTTFKSIGDILVGEVWLAGGQSNMALNVGTSIDSEEILANANNSNLRFYLEDSYPNGQNGAQPLDPMDDVTGAYWGRGDDQNSVNRMSAVAYSFAKTLQQKLDVPVAILNTPTGGTVIEAWTPREAIEADQDLVLELKRRGLYYDESFWSTSAGTMSTLYNQKIGPITNFNIAGAIWYQGESNSNRSEIYDKELTVMKKSWSDAFGFENNSMPFIYTQVAAGQYDNGSKNMQHLAYLAEAMTRSFRANENNKMAMLTIYDMPLTHVKNGVSSAAIHPRTKTPVGQRFAESAMNLVYGGDQVYTAPVYKSMEIKGNAIYVTFDYVGDGLSVIDNGTLHGFTIAGSDGIYVNAKAEIVGKNQVKVYNSRVKKPKNVTYAFSNLNQASNLINSSNIPAAPFRTQKVTDTDTTVTPTKQMTYFTALDWMYADQDVWVYDENNPDKANQSLGFRPSWETENAAYSYSTEKKAEGKASLKLDITQAGKASVGPILNYGSQKINLGNFKNMSVKISNPAGVAKTVSLSIVSGGKTYTVMPENASDANVTLNSGDSFDTVTFDMTALKDGADAVENTADLWKNIEKMAFTFDAANAGTVYFDDVSFGMTEWAEDESDEPVASVDFSGETPTAVNMSYNLGSKDVEIIEKEGRNAVSLGQYKYLNFAVDPNVVSKDDHDVIIRITYLDNGNAYFGVNYNTITDKDPASEGSDTKFKLAPVNRTGTEKWVTSSVCLSDASFRHAMFNQYDFRIYGNGVAGTYISKVEVLKKSVDPDNEEIAERAGASEHAEFTGKSFAGYQAWFGTGDQYSSWGHYDYGSAEADGTAWPRKDHISIDYFPYVKDYDESALAQTGFANLGSGEPTKLYDSTNEQVIDTHFKWMHDYGIDGAAIQRFAGVIKGRAMYDTPENTQLYKMKTAAEKNDSLFYIMYDISGGNQITDADDTTSISPYVEDIKFDWVYNIEKALQMTNSKAYATVNGKPVVCFWGTTVGGRPNRVADYQELIDFFHKKDCYVIFGVQRDWSVNNTIMEKYGDVLKKVDMISPWMVGSNVGSEEAIDSLFKTFTEKDWKWCQENNVDYYPVVFSGFSWALWHNNDKPNAMPRNAGQNLWYQAYKIRQLGIPSFYIAMFDEYDEGTAIAKNASDYFDIPTDQWFVTASCDGYWLSEDFQLRVAGEANRMVKGEREAVKDNPVEHSLGPVYYRNSFESMYVNCPAEQYRGDYPVDPCFKNDKLVSKDGADATVAIEKNELAKTGNYMTTIKGTAEKENAQYLYQISETKILLKRDMKLSWSVYAADEGGKDTFITLICDDGSRIEVKPETQIEKGAWTDCSAYVGNKSNEGKRIVGIAIGYAGGAGDFTAYYDDVILADGDAQQYTVNVAVNKDGKVWEDHAKTFELVDAEENHITDLSKVTDGTYRVFDKTANTDTGVVAVVDGEACNVTVDYYTVSFVADERLTETEDAMTDVVCKGAAVTKVPALTVKDGYHFAGWYTDEECTKVADFSQIKVEDAQTFYAKIEENPKEPADKSKLNAYLETVEGLNEKDYTEESWKNLQEAVEAAKNLSDDCTQEEADAAADAVKTAIDGLKKKPEEKPVADKTQLNAYIEATEKLDEDAYTEESWKNLQDAVTAAKELPDDCTQEEADAAAEALKTAIDGLTKKPTENPEVDKTKVETYLEAASKFDEGDYTKESWKTLQDAMEAAKNLPDDCTQEEADAAAEALKTAIDGLEKKPAEEPKVDKTKVEVYLEVASKFDESNYTEESWKKLEDAVTAAKNLPDDCTQEEADAAAEALKAAIDGLERKPEEVTVDKSELNAYIEMAEKLNAGDYTAESYQKLQNAVTAGKNLAENSTQEQVDAATAAIKAAMDGLVKAPANVNPDVPKNTESTEKPKDTETTENPKDTEATEKPAEPGRIILSADKKTLGVKEKYKLGVKTTGVSGKVQFKTSNKKVVVVSKNGVITAKKNGKATITAYTADGVYAVCKVTVKKAPASVKFTAKSKDLKKGKTLQLKVKLSKGSAGSVTYTSSNKKIVKVDKNGKIKALKKGKAVITVKTYNKKTDKIVITVR